MYKLFEAKPKPLNEEREFEKLIKMCMFNPDLTNNIPNLFRERWMKDEDISKEDLKKQEFKMPPELVEFAFMVFTKNPEWAKSRISINVLLLCAFIKFGNGQHLHQLADKAIAILTFNGHINACKERVKDLFTAIKFCVDGGLVQIDKRLKLKETDDYQSVQNNEEDIKEAVKKARVAAEESANKCFRDYKQNVENRDELRGVFIKTFITNEGMLRDFNKIWPDLPEGDPDQGCSSSCHPEVAT